MQYTWNQLLDGLFSYQNKCTGHKTNSTLFLEETFVPYALKISRNEHLHSVEVSWWCHVCSIQSQHARKMPMKPTMEHGKKMTSQLTRLRLTISAQRGCGQRLGFSSSGKTITETINALHWKTWSTKFSISFQRTRASHEPEILHTQWPETTSTGKQN